MNHVFLCCRRMLSFRIERLAFKITSLSSELVYHAFMVGRYMSFRHLRLIFINAMDISYLGNDVNQSGTGEKRDNVKRQLWQEIRDVSVTSIKFSSAVRLRIISHLVDM